MKVKVKKLSPDAIVPQYAKEGDAGLDLVGIDYEIDENTGKIKYSTGLAIEIPEGYVGFIYPRSSIIKTDLALANSVGVIDSGYRGEIKVVFSFITDKFPTIYEKGDRIAQLIIAPYPYIVLTEVEELTGSKRGEGGFGSTGR